MGKIAVVVLNGATREFDKQYHYMVPQDMEERVVPGVRVIVPFGGGNTSKEGYVTGLTDTSEYAVLKSISKVIDDKPVLSEKLLCLAAWMRGRYICTYSDAIKCMLPAGIGIKSHRMAKLKENHNGVLESGSKRAADLLKIVEVMSDNGGELDFDELKKITGFKNFSKLIKELEQKGNVSICEVYTTAVKEKYIRAAYLAMPAEEVLDDIENNRLKNIKQIRILEMLLENEYISTSDIVRFAGVSAAVLNTLRKYGYIEYRDIEVKRDPTAHMKIERTFPLKPTEQQEKSLEEIKGRLDKREFSEILIHGVTGSGKTEVYLQLIQYAIDQGRQAIVLVPEISLTPQMVERFKGRFGDKVAVLHSRLSLGERYDQWRLIKEGEIKVVVGARSAIFAPLEKLGIVVIDEEHENTYNSEMTPKYKAAEVAAKRCRDEGAVLVYGSATPSVETYYRAEKGEIGLVSITERTNRMMMPHVHISDMRKELEAGNWTPFSTRLSEEIAKNIVDGQQTILFLNRRGYASFVLCRNCGLTVKCLHCNISLTYHSHDERLICHYCGYTERMPSVCPKCGSTYIKQFGTGTQKIEEETKKHFEGCSVLRMDMDTTTGKNSHEEILNQFRNKNVNILVGTQMIAKGHDFPNVTLVGVLAADSLLSMDDFRASERTFQLITQVAGRAGRGELPGRVIIQTYNTEDFSILAACSYDYMSFYRQEIRLREKLGYPPFTNIASIIVNAASDLLAMNKAKEVRDILDSQVRSYGHDAAQQEDLILGPMRAPLSKIRNRYRWRIIMKCGNMEKLIEVLTRTGAEFRKHKGKIDADLNMDINPNSML